MKPSVARVPSAIFTGVVGLVAGCAGEPRYAVTPQWRELRTADLRVEWHQVSTMPHDDSLFTEGLTFLGSDLYESSGGYGNSRVIKVNPSTGVILLSKSWPRAFSGDSERPFAEGLTSAGNILLQLSWKNQRALSWSGALVRGPDHTYRGEGWGVCSDGTHLWRSDGTARLHRHEGANFSKEVEPALPVTINGQPLANLNELECVGTTVLANVWQTPFVVLISSATGAVTGVLDLEPLVRDAKAWGSESVLNGIAWDKAGHRLFVTGKRWSKMYTLAVPSLEASAPSGAKDEPAGR